MVIADLQNPGALEVGFAVLAIFILMQGIAGGIRLILDWRKLTTAPRVPMGEQFVTRDEISHLENRLTIKLNEQDNRLAGHEERTRVRIHDLANQVNEVKLLVARLPGELRKDLEAMLKPISDHNTQKAELLVAIQTKLDILLGTNANEKKE